MALPNPPTSPSLPPRSSLPTAPGSIPSPVTAPSPTSPSSGVTEPLHAALGATDSTPEFCAVDALPDGSEVTEEFVNSLTSTQVTKLTTRALANEVSASGTADIFDWLEAAVKANAPKSVFGDDAPEYGDGIVEDDGSGWAEVEGEKRRQQLLEARLEGDRARAEAREKRLRKEEARLTRFDGWLRGIIIGMVFTTILVGVVIFAYVTKDNGEAESDPSYGGETVTESPAPSPGAHVTDVRIRLPELVDVEVAEDADIGE